MNITIREGIKDDLPSVLKLIKELADYEKAIDQVTITLDDLEQDGFGSHPWFWFLVAEKDSVIIGISFYWIRYSTWKGIGSKLFEETIKICKKLNLNGMTWQVLDWNIPAIDFYKKFDAEISKEWLNGKLTKKQIENINKIF